mgnify:CR=1 FL=1
MYYHINHNAVTNTRYLLARKRSIFNAKKQIHQNNHSTTYFSYRKFIPNETIQQVNKRRRIHRQHDILFDTKFACWNFYFCSLQFHQTPHLSLEPSYQV